MINFQEWSAHPNRLLSILSNARPRMPLGSILLATLMLVAVPAQADTCSNLKNSFSMPHLTITSAETIPAGTFKTSNSDGRVPVSDIPAFAA